MTVEDTAVAEGELASLYDLVDARFRQVHGLAAKEQGEVVDVEKGIVEMAAQVGHAEQPLAVGEAFAMQVGDFGRRRQGVLEIEIADVAKGRRKVVHG